MQTAFVVSLEDGAMEYVRTDSVEPPYWEVIIISITGPPPQSFLHKRLMVSYMGALLSPLQQPNPEHQAPNLSRRSHLSRNSRLSLGLSPNLLAARPG